MKRIVLIVGVAALAFSVGACGSTPTSSGSAAVVNGGKISNRSLVDELEAISGNADYLASIESQVPVTGKAAGSFEPAFVAQVLTRQIQYTLIEQEVKRRNLDVGQECKDAAKSDQIGVLAGGDTDKGAEIFESFPKGYQDDLIRWNANVFVLEGDFIGEDCIASEAAAQHYFDAHQDEFVQTCASHILVDTEADADAIQLQLQQGADFAALATQLSKDAASAAKGGDLWCFNSGDLVAEFETAATGLDIGEVSPPVKTEFGWHIIKVTGRKTPAFAEVADQLPSKLADAAGGPFGTYFQDAVAKAEITVDKRYGAWDEEAGQITPPGASTTTSSEPAPSSN